jgi:hypothetical protein
VFLNDLLTDGEANASAGILRAVVKPFENSKHLGVKFFWDSNSIVFNREAPMIAVLACGDPDPGLSLTSVFQGVRKEILEQMHQRNGVATHHWKGRD